MSVTSAAAVTALSARNCRPSSGYPDDSNISFADIVTI
jgi:hypothetical protein